MWKRYLIVLVTLVVASTAATLYYNQYIAQSSFSAPAQVQTMITSFGDKLQQVPLVAPPAIVAFAMDKYYAVYVHPDLLAKWKADPMNAPGRTATSPWPDSISVESAKKNPDGSYRLEVFIVMLTDAPGSKTTKSLQKAVFTVVEGPDGWQITNYAKM